MFATIVKFRSRLIVWLAAMVLVGQARAVDFEFLYDDLAGQGRRDRRVQAGGEQRHREQRGGDAKPQ